MEYIANTDQGHWLKEKFEGDLLLLDDDSLWEIHPDSGNRAQHWIRFSSVKVTAPDLNTKKPVEFGYILVNHSYRDAVRAKYLGITDHSERSALRQAP